MYRTHRLLIAWLVLGMFPTISAAELRDPTRPMDFSELEGGLGLDGAPTSTAHAAFVLQSILVSPTRRIAIVNGERVQKGDQIGSARVLEIQPWFVQLRGSEGDIELRMTTIQVKTPVDERSEGGR